MHVCADADPLSSVYSARRVLIWRFCDLLWKKVEEMHPDVISMEMILFITDIGTTPVLLVKQKAVVFILNVCAMETGM